ncbi:vWA domain-containing protein [Hydrogenimonas sp.]
MSVEAKIAKAKTRLVVRHPWFGLLASRLATESSDEVEAFLSDGRVLQYNPDFFAEEPLESIEFALANSVMHHVLAHENRRLKRQGWLWQLATDYAVNGMLKENGFTLPGRVNFEERFAGRYAEEIYAILKDEIRNEEYSDDESNEEGFNEQNRNRTKEERHPDDLERKSDIRRPMPPQELEPEVEEMWAEAMEEALQRAEAQGHRPGGIERFVQRSAHAAVDWQSELYHAIRRHQKSDYTFARPNKKMLARGVYLPSIVGEELVVTVAIDSSSSVDEVLLGRFVAELEALFLNFPNTEIDLLVCDAKIQGVWRFVSGEVLDFTLKGGGGTDFRPVFDHISTSIPDTSLLIYFTDARGSFPDTPPPYETLWIVPDEAEVPFGRTIMLEPVSEIPTERDFQDGF